MAGTAIPSSPVVHRSRGVVRANIAMTCDASGVLSASVIGEFYGRLVGVFYDGGLDASAVITFKDVRSGATLLTYTTGTEGTATRFRPTTNVTDNVGAAVTAATTAPNVARDIKVAGQVSITVASGGTSETGTIALIFDETRRGIGDLALTV